MTLEVTHLRPAGAKTEAFALETVMPPTASDAVRAEAVSALEAPIGFPPISQAVTPDDYVAIALAESIPAADAVVAGLIEKLASCGLDRARMVVVTIDEITAESLRAELPEESSAGVRFVAHRPEDEESLCFAGMTKSDRQLRLNRWLFDADVLLPVSSEETSSAGDGSGPFDGFFPTFFDRETIHRVQRVRGVAAARARGGDHARARRREADEAGWLAGAPLIVCVVPSVGGNPPRVLAGEPAAVSEETLKIARELWDTEPPETPTLLIARLRLGRLGEGRRWVDVGRAFEAIEPIVPPGAAIALWTELDEPIGEMIGRLRLSDNPARVAETLLDESGAEALAAWRIACALDRGTVYLHSRLSADVVEELGFAPLASAEELERLAARHERPYAIEDAQYVCFAKAEE